MSSNATMPLIFEGNKKNAKQPDLTLSVVLITAGFHPVSDCFFIIILSMLSLITALYVVFYPIITSANVANVMGNSAFTIMFTKLYDKFKQCLF
ncbi:hypothetical protein [Wolbachia endosymbiont of Litomosoides brasiliensis]|uniref:hypothetical protein n=1 Tax=Wolbachia endosymbiont of Litomosoides brasiliensis TaxID=1812117 RepID=UPI001FE761FA|nr:hypothetical protein [Wolbachia endosymbiont of Litomosoides brasiliensis]